MSLLADLLSKVKYQGHKGDIPPNLRQVVADSTERSAVRRKVAVLTVLTLIAIAAGFGAVYVFQAFIKPAAVKPAASLPQPGNLQTAAVPAPPVVQPAAPVPASSPAQESAPVQPPPKKKPLSKKRSISGKRPATDKDEETLEALEALEHRVQDKSPSLSSTASADAEVAAAKKEPKQLSSEDSEKRDMYLYSAQASESRKDYQQALSNYMKALELDPHNSGIYIIMNNIAGIMIRMGRYDEALQYAGNALKLNKDYLPSLINFGIASIKLNNTADGEKFLARALTLEPSNRNALLNLALLKEKTREYDNAYSSYYRLAQLGDIQGYLGLARVAEKKGKKQDAARIYREILSMNNIDPQIKKLADERIQAIGNGQ